MANIHNLSPRGLNLRTNVDLPITDKKMGVRISFTLIDETITADGSLLWKKREVGTYSYGVKLQKDEAMERKIINELKRFARLKIQNSSNKDHHVFRTLTP